MSDIKNIFKEFIELSYKPSNYRSFSDIKIDNYIICRKDHKGYSIIYLYSGSQFIFPWEWCDIFSSFNTYLGDRVEYLKVMEDDSTSKIINLVTSIFISLENKLHNIKGQDILELLGEISLIKTDDFRDWCNLELKLKLDPLNFRSLKGEIEI